MSVRTPGRDIVGLIPAAGRATRISPLPCSKELLPVGWQRDAISGTPRPKVVSQYLLERMKAAGANRAFFIVRDGKWDIASFYGDGSRVGLPIGYLNVGLPWGPPFTLSQAAPFIGEADVVFGFPDILVQPVDSFSPLLARMHDTGADVVLGLFDCRADEPGDVVDRTADGRVTGLVTKEERPLRPARYVCWMFAVWRASFTRFMSEECARLARVAEARVAEDPLAKAPEWPVGAVVAAAIRAGLHVDSHFFEQGRFLDVGTPDGLAAAPAFPLVWDGLGTPATEGVAQAAPAGR